MILSYIFWFSLVSSGAQPVGAPQNSQIEAGDCSCTKISADETTSLHKFSEALKSKADINLLNNCQQSDCKTVLAWGKDLYKQYPFCSEFFVNDKNNLGELTTLSSKEIVNDIGVHGENSVFLKNYPDIEKICPGYKKMRSTIKVVFWSWLFEILAFPESSCKPDAMNWSQNVPHPPAVGLYQLEQAQSLRSWRGPNCRVDDGKILEAGANTACAADILKSHLKRNGQLFGHRNDKDKLIGLNYWEALNEPSAKKAGNPKHPHNLYKKRLERFPLCNQK